MLIDLEDEPRKLRLEYPSTELKISKVEIPITLSSKISDKNGSLWEVQATKVSLEASHKKRAVVKVNGLITVHKDKKIVLNRDGLLFVHNTDNEFWNNYLNYPIVYENLLASDIYRKGDKKRFIEAVNPVNNKLIEIARAMRFMIDSTRSNIGRK
jgi:hypothetical protein|tara:strand:- start:175 stop:639 length:465 start_codon:yes stop_codon:yes gene_type:complete